MIKIIADSTCDLSQEVVEKYDIGIAPLTITIDGKIYRDRVDLLSSDFFKIMEDLDSHPTTAMPSPTEFITLFENAVKNGFTEILCICMSSGTSGSYQSAVIAKDLFIEEHGANEVKIYIVDSHCMSHGSGWLILKSARLRECGATFEDLITFNETYKGNVKHFLSVDDLDHLLNSGRLSNASAFIGKMLKIKPIMTMKKTKGAIVAKIRGRKKVLQHYVTEFSKRVNLDVTDFIIIGYTSDLDYAENLKHKLLKDTGYNGEIFIMQMGVAVGTHVGLGAISMYFIENGDRADGLLINKLNALMDKKEEILKNRNI